MGSRGAVRERKPQEKSPAAVSECRHHWIIETPRGAMSSGRCKRCGEEREFRNSSSDYIWDDDSSTGSRSGYGGISGVGGAPRVALEDDDGVSASGPVAEESALTV